MSQTLRYSEVSLYTCDIWFLTFLSLSKTLKCASNDDAITMRAKDDTDSISYIFESPSEFISVEHFMWLTLHHLDGDKTAQYDIRLMDIDSEHLGIPVSAI